MKKGRVQLFKRVLLIFMCAVLMLSFTVTASAVDADGSYEEDPDGNPYTDVSRQDPQVAWAYDAILGCYQNGVLQGTGSTTFSPNMIMSRAMVVTALYKLSEKPAVQNNAGFSDVPADAWYADAVNWAAENNIANGGGGNAFAPDRDITRGEFVTILRRYAEWLGADTNGRSDLNGFLDGNTVPDWALDGVQWAVYANMIQGAPADGGVVINCAGYTTRKEAAVLLMRFMLYLAET